MHCRSSFFNNSGASLFLLLVVCLPFNILGQPFSRSDSLRGTLNEFRKVYDVTFYDLNLKVNPEQQSLSGSNTIHYDALHDFRRIQVDLFANMRIDSITSQNRTLPYKREGNAVFIDFPTFQQKGTKGAIKIYYG